jgi:predicted nucleic acid-binding protein
MKIVADADILSIFAKIKRLDILDRLFKEIIIPLSVRSELMKGGLNVMDIAPGIVKLTRDELRNLRGAYPKIGRGERECIVISKSRSIPLASNDRVVNSLCRTEGVEHLSLIDLLRFAILQKVITREEARELIKLIEREENTTIKNKEEIFK